MESHLKRLEGKSGRRDDYDLAIEHAALRQLLGQDLDELGEVAIERLLVAALNEDLAVILEDECAEAVPLGLEDPLLAGWKVAHPFGEHRQNRRIDRQIQDQSRSLRRSCAYWIAKACAVSLTSGTSIHSNTASPYSDSASACASAAVSCGVSPASSPRAV